MSEEATRQSRTPVDTGVREEATSQVGRWGHPSPAAGPTASPVPDQSRVYLTDTAPQVSPQPIRQGENEATLTHQHHQQSQQAGQVTTINIPQHPHHPHHKYQLLHGATTDSQQQQQQHIIQHSSTVIQQQQQHPSPAVIAQHGDQHSEDQHSQRTEEVSHGEPRPQEHSPYPSTAQAPAPASAPEHPAPPRQAPQEVSPYNAQLEAHDLAVAEGAAPQTENQPQASATPTGKENDTPSASVHHPSTIKEVYVTQG